MPVRGANALLIRGHLSLAKCSVAIRRQSQTFGPLVQPSVLIAIGLDIVIAILFDLVVVALVTTARNHLTIVNVLGEYSVTRNHNGLVVLVWSHTGVGINPIAHRRVKRIPAGACGRGGAATRRGSRR